MPNDLIYPKSHFHVQGVSLEADVLGKKTTLQREVLLIMPRASFSIRSSKELALSFACSFDSEKDNKKIGRVITALGEQIV